MYTGRDFQMANTLDNDVFGFDFVHDIDETDSIVSTVWSIATNNGQDPAPATLFTSPPYTLSRTSVSRRISGLVEGVSYTLECVATTAQGNVVSLWSYIRSEVPN